MAQEDVRADFIVIGAGMAGASVAAELSREARVILLERETQPGYHTTGRSAALFTVAYGPPVIRALSRASHAFFRGEGPGEPPPGLVRPRGVLFIAREDQAEAREELAHELGDAVTPVPADEARRMVPILREGYVASAMSDPLAADIEVHGLHQHYLRAFRARDGALHLKTEVLGLARNGGDWSVETRQGTFRAPVVINAGGAWADELARMAGVAQLGLRPLRRTALLVAPPAGGFLPEARRGQTAAVTRRRDTGAAFGRAARRDGCGDLRGPHPGGVRPRGPAYRAQVGGAAELPARQDARRGI